MRIFDRCAARSIEHCLAVEQLRRRTRAREPVPRRDRRCRFCTDAVEDGWHALFLCGGSERLGELRAAFRETASARGSEGNAAWQHGHVRHAWTLFLANRALIAVVARFVCDVLQEYGTHPMRTVRRPRIMQVRGAATAP